MVWYNNSKFLIQVYRLYDILRILLCGSSSSFISKINSICYLNRLLRPDDGPGVIWLKHYFQKNIFISTSNMQSNAIHSIICILWPWHRRIVFLLHLIKCSCMKHIPRNSYIRIETYIYFCYFFKSSHLTVRSIQCTFTIKLIIPNKCFN